MAGVARTQAANQRSDSDRDNLLVKNARIPFTEPRVSVTNISGSARCAFRRTARRTGKQNQQPWQMAFSHSYCNISATADECKEHGLFHPKRFMRSGSGEKWWRSGFVTPFCHAGVPVRSMTVYCVSVYPGRAQERQLVTLWTGHNEGSD